MRPVERRPGRPGGDVIDFFGLAADHYALERVRTAEIRTELGARKTGCDRTRRRIDDRLGRHRLTSRAIRHHDAAWPPRSIAEDVGHITTIEVLDAGLQQCVVERAFDMHRAGRRRRFAI